MSKDYLEKIIFNEVKINTLLNQVNSELKIYIEKNIISEYELNDKGHNIEHINYVLKRAFELINGNINIDILYTCIMFHDIACHIDRQNHEILSAIRAFEDDFLNSYFGEKNMTLIKEAIEDHRASLNYEPRNIYGKILSSSDRKVEIKVYLASSMNFEIKTHPEFSKNDVIKASYDFALKKFGKAGYAINKSYVTDGKYEIFLNDLQYLLDNKQEYFEVADIVYKDILKII